MVVNNTASTIVGVRFHKIGRVYHFDTAAHPELRPGDFVIVETSRGRRLGQIIGFISSEKVTRRIKPIKGPATARDLMMQKLWEAKEPEALAICREVVSEVEGLEGVKFILAKYNYDGSVLAFLYTTEEDVTNTKQLRKRLEREFHTRVEMRRVGARDAAKLLGEYGACSEPRCCVTHLAEFSPISIKMAKTQRISLNPSEITGMCGRLRCCLLYEHQQYVDARKGLPKINKQVATPRGEGRVVGVNPLKQTVTVQIEENRHEVHRDDLQSLDEYRAVEAQAAQGCAREGLGGRRECGRRVHRGSSTKETPREKDSKTKTDRRDKPDSKKGKPGKRRSGRRGSRRRSGKSRRPRKDKPKQG